MSRFLSISPSRLFAGLGLSLLAPFALAGGSPDVSWSVTIGSPLPRVYIPAPVVYVEPQPVYIRPQPVYVRPAPIVHYAPTYYVEEGPYRKSKHRHWKHRHHHDD
ncbi:MAG TPA: hypothetical protein VFF81_02530 [Noviherbaspirillum sp.]|nr:hypothetical protein [Noviherbaspirillum sp.]